MPAAGCSPTMRGLYLSLPAISTYCGCGLRLQRPATAALKPLRPKYDSLVERRQRFVAAGASSSAGSIEGNPPNSQTLFAAGCVLQEEADLRPDPVTHGHSTVDNAQYIAATGPEGERVCLVELLAIVLRRRRRRRFSIDDGGPPNHLWPQSRPPPVIVIGALHRRRRASRRGHRSVGWAPLRWRARRSSPATASARLTTNT